jgi:hypothetical protein
MTWVLAGVAAWVVLAVLVGVLVGRGIRLADRMEAERDAVSEPNFVVDPAVAADSPQAGAPPVVSRARVAASEPRPRPRDPGTA